MNVVELECDGFSTLGSARNFLVRRRLLVILDSGKRDVCQTAPVQFH